MARWAEIRTDAGTSSALHRARSNAAHTPPHHRFGDTRRVCPPLPWPRRHAQPRRVCGDVTGTRQTARREPRESVEPNPPGHNSRQRHIPHPPQLLAIPSAPSRAAPTCPTRQPPRTYCSTRLLPTTSGAHRPRPFSVLMVVGTPTHTHRRRTPQASSTTFPKLRSSSSSQIALCFVTDAGSWLNGGGRADPELNDYVGSAGMPSPSAGG
jgi:hypothetical protein